MITQKRLKELLDYDEITGVFTWKAKSSSKTIVGSVAGHLRKDGYRDIGVDGRLYLAHRLAWFYMHGVWPKDKLDHKDTIGIDNWLDNLREVNHSENMMNQRAPHINNKCGFLGVCYNKALSKFKSHIRVNGKLKHLGYFTTPEEAHQAYLTAKRELHKTCTI